MKEGTPAPAAGDPGKMKLTAAAACRARVSGGSTGCGTWKPQHAGRTMQGEEAAESETLGDTPLRPPGNRNKFRMTATSRVGQGLAGGSMRF